MSVVHAHPTPRGAGHLLRAVVAAWLLVLALVAPAGAVEGPTRLFSPSVSPTTATPTTTVTLSVEYRNREGSAPAYVRVVIDGTAHDMTGDGGDDWKQGVAHRFSTKLSAGTHEVSFVAADTRKFTDAVDGGSITVAIATNPPPAPTPTPNKAPDPTPAPIPAPGSESPQAPGVNGSAGAGGTGSTDGAPDGADGPDASNPGSVGSVIGGVGDRGRVSDGRNDSGEAGLGTTYGSTLDRPPAENRGAGTPDDDDPDAAVVVPPDAGAGGSSGGSMTRASRESGGLGGTSGAGGAGGAGWGTFASALDALGVDNAWTTTLTTVPTLIGTSGAVAMAMAFAIFGKKRRDEEPPAPDEVLEANAARGGTVAASAALVGAPVVPAPVDLEASMPRWRRPSLQEARRADPTRTAGTTPSLRFDNSDASTIGYERRLIRYRVVRLLDAPDELRSVEIGQLDQGDEVQLLEKSGGYWLVRTPDGRQGWLHKMTLGDLVGDSATSTADAWNVGDIDGDVLSAYLAARARA